MESICFILFLSVASLWFFSNEYPTLFGVYVPTCVLRRVSFKVVVAVSLLAAMVLSAGIPVHETVASVIMCGRTMDCRHVLLLLLASLITLSVLRLLSVKGASVYAFTGSFVALAAATGSLSKDVYKIIIGIVMSPVVAFVLSLVIRYLLRVTLGRSHMHLIRLSYYMRIAVIIGIILTSGAVGLNWGGFLLGASEVLLPDCYALWCTFIVVALVLAVMAPFMRDESDEGARMYGDFSIYSVLAVGFAVSLTLLVFSFRSTTGFLGLVPTPLSTGALVLAAIAGTEVAQRSHLIEREEYSRGILALLVAPLGSFLLTYLILRLSGAGKDAHLTDFIVMSSAVLVLVALFFAGYIRSHRRQRLATERLVYSQQQQIYEHSRALNDMELKVVLSENQALHNSIEMKKQEVMNVALSIVEQREYLESLDAIVKRLAKSSDEKERSELIAELGSSLKQRLSYDRDVDSQYFYAQAEYLHEDFNAKLSENFPDLTQQERRLATLLRLGFSSKYIATLMNITPKSVEISRYRLRQKLGLSKGDNLVNYIKSI